MTMQQGLKANFTNEAKLGWDSLFQQTDAIMIDHVFG